MPPLLGAIADDFTGATDLASFLVASGMRTVQVMGIPTSPLPPEECDALVVSLKTRTVPPQQAIEASLAALGYLQEAGCRRFYFKYCSTFDSTERGNIGPVTDALLTALGASSTIICPALPVNGRTVYNGHLFVNGRLLNESGMENHPLTPMRDPDLVRFLARQTGGGVGLLGLPTVLQGATAAQEALTELGRAYRYVVTDAVREEDLLAIGQACADLPLVTGGSGLAPGLALEYRHQGLLTGESRAAALAPVAGETVILSGSCSTATRAQVAEYRQHHPMLQIEPMRLQDGSLTVAGAMDWFKAQRASGPVLISASDAPEAVGRSQQALGTEQAGELVERFFAELAVALREQGVSRFVVAGGETSGAVVQALGVSAIRIGPAIAPGVPLTRSLGADPLLLALKSGNFGDVHFFQKAVEMMQ